MVNNPFVPLLFTGSFTETEYYPQPLHKPMDGHSNFKNDYAEMRNISLTAHVLVAIEATAANLQGKEVYNQLCPINCACQFTQYCMVI